MGKRDLASCRIVPPSKQKASSPEEEAPSKKGGTGKTNTSQLRHPNSIQDTEPQSKPPPSGKPTPKTPPAKTPPTRNPTAKTPPTVQKPPASPKLNLDAARGVLLGFLPDPSRPEPDPSEKAFPKESDWGRWLPLSAGIFANKKTALFPNGKVNPHPPPKETPAPPSIWDNIQAGRPWLYGDPDFGPKARESSGKPVG
ncbi:hypothetical protein CDD80_1901 [Ophiocordyceps camponoti-rufipedis]|uniref:Uncharacterized protein n=1 Tax=Ophiocordyceps camponoti-rufipedis TaxID=2004952 RepID=A0A2C5XDV1_9HYPO|nr:hypothetical protein CDD80_1901 [Ophiocordyceps camponoti-rufipedis]